MPHRRRSPASTARPAVALVVAAAALAACSDGSPGSDACGPITREALDPAYLVHVLGDDGSVDYQSDPPTSGPHQPAPPMEGVIDEPIPRPVQVGILEGGHILLQHAPDLPPAQLAELRALAGHEVVVAPNEDLPAPVVATAWTYTRRCDAVDRAALQDFIDERVGRGPGD